MLNRHCTDNIVRGGARDDDFGRRQEQNGQDPGILGNSFPAGCRGQPRRGVLSAASPGLHRGGADFAAGGADGDASPGALAFEFLLTFLRRAVLVLTITLRFFGNGRARRQVEALLSELRNRLPGRGLRRLWSGGQTCEHQSRTDETDTNQCEIATNHGPFR